MSADEDKRLNGAERDEYAAAGLAHGPKNAPFEAIEELAGVIGFNADMVRRIRPFVTVHSEQEGVDPAAVSPGLAELLARGVRDSGLESSGFSGSTRALPAQFLTASAKRHYGIIADVQTPRGARFIREAVVQRVDATPGPRARAADRGGTHALGLPYRIWRWRRGDAAAGTAPDAGADVPPC